MIKNILIATKNPGKFREITQALKGVEYQMVFLGDLDVEDKDFLEDGDTFEENAFLKARFYSKKLGWPTIADDAGILVEALPGELGVKTRRWNNLHNASDKEWLSVFMKRMENEKNRNALFKASTCLFFDENNYQLFSGEMKGKITDKLEADIITGLPLGSCFLVDGFDKVYNLMSEEEKKQSSHRGKALEQLRTKLLEEI